MKQLKRPSCLDGVVTEDQWTLRRPFMIGKFRVHWCHGEWDVDYQDKVYTFAFGDSEAKQLAWLQLLLWNPDLILDALRPSGTSCLEMLI